MIDKSLVKRRFKKSLKTYSDNAIVQKQAAINLIEMLPKKEYPSVFEIGCATGILTEQIIENIEFKTFTVNDIVDESKHYIDKMLTNYTFIAGDIESVNITNTYDLIISNACFQWCNSLQNLLSKLLSCLNKNGVLAFSVFGKDNMKELNKLFDITQKCYSKDELKSYFINKDNLVIKEETTQLLFNSPLDVLQHLKLTGANAVKEHKFTKSALNNFEQEYINRYSKNEKVCLTYNPVYVVYCKR